MRTKKQRLVDDLSAAMRRLGASTASLDRAAAQILGVNQTDLDAMEVLSRLGPMTAGELARAVGLSKTAVTTMIDRMVRAGFAERMPDESDRRRVIVRPTRNAAHRSWQIFGPLVVQSRTVYDSYTSAELELLLSFVDRSDSVLWKEARRLLTKAGNPGNPRGKREGT